MLSDALSDFADCIKSAIIDLSNSIEFYEENDELFGYGAELDKLIDMCKLIQGKFCQSDEIDLDLFVELYKFTYSTRVKHDAGCWRSSSAFIDVDTSAK